MGYGEGELRESARIQAGRGWEGEFLSIGAHSTYSYTVEISASAPCLSAKSPVLAGAEDDIWKAVDDIWTACST